MKISMPQFALSLALLAGSVSARPDFEVLRRGPPSDQAQNVFNFWTRERISKAVSRDFVYNGENGKGGERLLRGDGQQQQEQSRSLAVNNQYTDFSKPVMTAAGRIYFVMDGSGFVCSGTVTTDATTGRSIILTAAHCVYDDVGKAFASFVLFIPQQDDGGTDGTDTDCNNDPFGCWAPDFGVVEDCWASTSWPANIPCDWGYYVVNDVGAHSGTNTTTDVLDEAVATLPVDFTSTSNSCSDGSGVLMGYSYSDDPEFMFCDVDLEARTDGWEFPDCGLSGGASGGPGMFGCNLGDGPLTTVVSWSTTRGKARMGGPYLYNGLASCGYDFAKVANMTEASVDNGVVLESDGAGGCQPKSGGRPGSGGGGGGSGSLQCVPTAPIYCSNTDCPPVTTNPQVGDCCACAIYTGCPGGKRDLCNSRWQQVA